MYSEIAANKRKTFYLLFAFLGLIGGSALYYGYAFESPGVAVGALAGSTGYAFVSYFAASKMATGLNGAKEIEKRDNPRLWRIVENLAITNGMPMPKVYVIDDPALNAFATGRSPETAIVAATTGLLEKMDDSEVQGVMAHELGHVKNYDIRVSMIVFALVAAVSVMSDILLRVVFYSRNFSRNDRSGGSAVSLGLTLTAMILAPIAAVAIQLAISRRREYLADATGALTTRYPEGLASALEKIRDQGSTLKRQNTSTAHLFIANPLSGKSIATLFSTHPPVDERIHKLRNMGSHL